MGKLSNKQLLALLKKEGGCKTNQELLDLLEALADEMRKKRAQAVYQQARREVIKMGADKRAEVPIEIEIQRENADQD